MDSSNIVGLVNNAVLLLALGLLYDMLGFEPRSERPGFYRVLTGVFAGFMGIVIMSSPWDFGQGVFFDTRSVLLCICGFFFGTVPLVLAVAMTGAFRLLAGGAGAWTGVAVIATSGGMGLAWRRLRRHKRRDPSLGELYLFGVAVHVAMLLWMLSLPRGIAMGVLSQIGAPVMLIYPFATAILGNLMVNRRKRHQSEHETHERERFLQAIIQTTADGFWVLDTAGRIVEVNDAYVTMSGYGRDEILGMSIGDLDAVEGPGETAARVQRIMEKGSEIFETLHRRKDGSVFPVDVSVTFLREYGGRFVCFGRDVTERKDAEKIRRGSELKYRALFEQSADGIYVHDLEGRLMDVNKEAVSQSGYSKEELLGLSVFDLHPNHSRREDILRQWRQWPVEKSFVVEHWHRRKNGVFFPVEIKTGKVRFANGVCMLAVVRDLTDRRKAEEALREKEEYQRAMIDASPLAIVAIAPDGCVRSWNAAAERIFGWKSQEVVDRILPIVPENEREAFMASLARSAQGESLSRVRLARWRKDGSPVEISLSTAPIHDGEGRVVAIMGVIEDITEITEAEKEKERLQARLIQAQKMESVGRLAGGVAHDYNNMLGVILGYTEMSLQNLSPEDSLHQNLQEILKAARRSADITRQLLAFSRQQTIAPKVLDLNETVESMLKMLRRLIGEDIDLSWHPGKRLWPVSMDPTQLDQVLVNLCVNARDAIADTGSISIETGTKTFDEAYCASHPGFVPGRFVMVSVSDDGCGMDRETQERLFEPFFTTKETGKGTGLGLATVYGIVRQNEGFINVYSEPGQGTTFRIYLPRHEAAVEQAGDKDAVEPDVRGSETILVVEDERKILRMATIMLEQLGYTVLAASRPAEAVALAGEHAGEIHLLMTDVVMPDMNGRELSVRLRALYPRLKVLFMSGYTANVIAHRGVLDEGVNFIQKPFSQKDLGIKVRRSLGDRGR